MEYEPDYSRYTLDELEDTNRHIDRERYPERARILQEEIEKRRTEPQSARANPTINPYKTFEPRFLAGILDGLVFLPMDLLSKAIWSYSDSVPVALLALCEIVSTLAFTVYSILMTGRYGQTLGKMAVKVKVFDLSGNPVSMSQAFRRDSVVLLLNVLSLVVGLPMMLRGTPFGGSTVVHFVVYRLLGLAGILWFVAEMVTMLTNRKRRAIHDLIAGSVVMRVPN